MLIVDVKNAFNNAPWNHILDALRIKNVPQYLQKIMGAYLSNRRINVTLPSCGVRNIDVQCGVLQGSVLRPDLWSLLYDGLLRISLPLDVEIVAFADNVTLIATAEAPFLLEDRLEHAFSDVVDWLSNPGLEVVVGKTCARADQ